MSFKENVDHLVDELTEEEKTAFFIGNQKTCNYKMNRVKLELFWCFRKRNAAIESVPWNIW